MLTAAATFLHDMATEAEPRWLALLGTSGAGKTLLGRAIHTAVVKFALTKSYTSRGYGEGLGTHYRADYKVRWEVALARALDEREWDWMRELFGARFALVDEICSEYLPKEKTSSKLSLLAEERMGKWTVWTSNVGVQTLKDHWDARIASRLLRHGSVVVDVDVPDFNLPNHGRTNVG